IARTLGDILAIFEEVLLIPLREPFAKFLDAFVSLFFLHFFGRIIGNLSQF
ncbi:MAG: hypothetical protein ACD_65C00048G0003, partial [uncultured bacterium]